MDKGDFMEWKRLIRVKSLWWIYIMTFLVAGILFWEFCQNNRNMDLDYEYWKQEQKWYVDQFEENLYATIDRAEYMKGISIFNEQGSYSEKNIEKTKEDAEKLLKITPEILETPFVIFWLEGDLSDYLLFLPIFSVIMIFLQERREGMWSVVRLTQKGRGELLAQRLILLVVLISISVLVLYLIRFIICCFLFGIFDQWAAPIQSNSDFSFFVKSWTIIEYVIFFLMTKICGYVVLAWLFYGIFCTFRENRIAYLLIGACLVGEWMIKHAIHTNSKFYVLSLINVFGFIDTYRFTSVYHNLNVMGWAVSSVDIILVAFFVIGVLNVIWLAFLERKQYPNIQRKRYISHLIQKIRKKKRRKIPAAFVIEGKKIFIFQKGFILLILLGMLQGYRMERQFQYLSREEVYLQAYYNMFEGPVNEEDMKAAEKERVLLQNNMDHAQDKDFLRSYSEQKQAFDTVYEELQRVWFWRQQGENTWLMNPKGYQKLLEVGIDKGINLSLCISWILLLSIGSWYQEKKNGMLTIFHLTPRGVPYIQKQKIRWMVFYTVLVFGMVFGVEIGNILYRFPIAGMQASIKSLAWMEGLSGPIWLYLIGYYFLFLLILIIILEIGMYVAYFRYTAKR